MKVTHFGVDGFPWAHVANFGGTGNVITIGSNTNTDPPLTALNFVQRITSNGSNALLNPLVNFAAGSNIYFTLDQGPLPAQAYPSNTLRIHSTGGGGGNIITANGSNSLAAVVNLVAGTGIALGVSGQNVTITNTGSSGSGVDTNGLVLLEQHTASTSASLDFTAFISSTYDTYHFEFLNVVPATNNVDFYAQVGTGGGPTYDTGSNYSNTIFAYSKTGTASTGGVTTSWKARNNAEINNNTNGGVGGWGEMWYPQSTTTFRRLMFDLMYISGDPVGAKSWCEYIGNSGTALTAIKFYFSSGNITSGTIRVYGVVKS